METPKNAAGQMTERIMFSIRGHLGAGQYNADHTHCPYCARRGDWGPQ